MEKTNIYGIDCYILEEKKDIILGKVEDPSVYEDKAYFTVMRDRSSSSDYTDGYCNANFDLHLNEAVMDFHCRTTPQYAQKMVSSD